MAVVVSNKMTSCIDVASLGRFSETGKSRFIVFFCSKAIHVHDPKSSLTKENSVIENNYNISSNNFNLGISQNFMVKVEQSDKVVNSLKTMLFMHIFIIKWNTTIECPNL